MHFDFLIEDHSGQIMLESLLPKIITSPVDTYRIHKYKGVGSIPKNLNTTSDPTKRALLNQLPRLLNGFGITYNNYGDSYDAVLIVVVDSDKKCLVSFKQELNSVLHACGTPPNARFCIAQEEGEAWFLGDLDALKAAYPSAKEAIVNNYIPDSICGTWEVLADAIYPKGSIVLKKMGYPHIGIEKCTWAQKITPYLNIESNSSQSFNYFLQTIKEFITNDYQPNE